MTDNVSDSDSLRRLEETEWGEDRTPTEAIVEAITDATGHDSLDIDPLQNHVDTDALDALVAGETENGDVAVSFEYEDLRVRVEGSGTVAVHAQGADE